MKRGWKIFALTILVLIATIIVIRANSLKEIDDVSPGVYCHEEYLKKANVLWVIPKFQNTPISENQTWCKNLLELNKTLGLHGIFHSHKEFNYYVNETEFQEAIQIFEKCFNQTPTMFKPPYLAISKENKNLIKKYGLKIKNPFQQTIHKVYHCNNTGTFSNKFHDLF